MMSERELERQENYINRILTDPTISINELVRLLEKNEDLTERILKKANTALYGRHRKATTLHQAIVLLGFRNIRQLLLEKQKETKNAEMKEKESGV